MTGDGVRVLVVAAPRSGAGLLQSLWLTDHRWGRSGLSGPDPLESVLDSRADSTKTDSSWSHRLTPEVLGSDDISAVRASLEKCGPWTLDWAPRNALRLPVVRHAVPDVRIVHITRDPRMAVHSLVEAWRTGRFVSEPGLPGWWGEPWSFPLIPGWRGLAGKPLHHVAAAQWLTIEETIRLDLDGIPDATVARTSYEALIADPSGELGRLASELGVAWSGTVPQPPELSPHTVTAPDPLKWQSDITETLAAFARVTPLHGAFLDWATASGFESYRENLVIQAASPLRRQTTRSSDGTPFKSAHTGSFVELLDRASSSLVISTYKSGHVIIARTAGEKLDTHVLGFDRPMGIAAAGSRLAIGTGQTIDSYVNQPAVSQRLDSDRDPSMRRHDGVYLPRSVTFTGDVAIHEMAYDADGVLWFVNTKFSCLCTQDLDNSFVVQWTPPWVSGLAADDRCHLNGLAMVDGRARFVTSLARTDTAGGWREHKGTSGLIYDLVADEIVAEGLSMPHSPRWHDGRLWVLQSGTGSLSTVDPVTGAITDIASLPGFTRGLAFIGRYALIGLSQVRESVFADLPITQSAAERNCGVWIIDTVTGSVVGLLRFEGVVQEIFDVAVLPQVRWPTLLDKGDLTARSYVVRPQDLRAGGGLVMAR
jgi:uncharacterized protein (TIGR03032 family)